MKISRSLSFATLALLALGLALIPPVTKAADGDSAAKLPVLGVAPGWKLKDLDGKEVSFAQFKGKVVVVDFWATWCGPCKHEIPGYIALQEKYGKDGLVIVGISVDQAGPEAVKKFVAAAKMNYVVVMADEGTPDLFGGMEAIPTTFLIDRAGKIRDRKLGVEETADYEKKILSVLN
jgi:thiol-disulfide isomerase/thioredoxin